MALGRYTQAAAAGGAASLTATTGVGALAAGLGFMVSEAMDAESTQATVAAVIEATGGAANVTAGDVADLASEIQGYSGFSDEAVGRAERLLLTFRNVRNEVGQGNQIFDRATTALADLSRAGFGDLESNAVRLGRALQDPVQGMTALARAGVTFSADQKAAVARMVETGDVLGAQKLILDEIEAQVGGVARAYGDTAAGDLARFTEGLSEIAETGGGVLLPVLTSLVDGARELGSTFSGIVGTLHLDDIVPPEVQNQDFWTDAQERTRGYLRALTDLGGTRVDVELTPLGEAQQRLEDSVQAFNNALLSADGLTAAVGRTEQEYENLSASVSEYVDTQFASQNVAVNAAEAQQALYESLSASRRNFNANTEAGRENIRNMEQFVSTTGEAVQQAFDYAAANGNVNVAQRRANAAIAASVGDLRRARDQGLITEQQFQNYKRTIEQIPHNVRTRVEANTAAAEAALAEIQRHLEAFAQRSFSAHVDIIRGGGFDTPGLGVEAAPLDTSSSAAGVIHPTPLVQIEAHFHNDLSNREARRQFARELADDMDEALANLGARG